MQTGHDDMTDNSSNPVSYSSAAALLLALGAVACAKAEAATQASHETSAIQVASVEVAEAAVPRRITLAGSLVANRESAVASDGAGKVVRTLIERGDFVKQGSVLVTLDSRAAVLGEQEAAAQAASARVQKKNAELECARAEALIAENVISRSEYDRMRASCESAVSSVQAAGARQLLAGKAVGDSRVRAPFAGLVVERNVTAGEYVVPGRQVATVVEVDPLRLELTVPEPAVAAVTADKRVEFSVAAYPGRTFSGSIRYVGPALRRAGRDLIAEALVENASHELRPGMFATARLAVGERRLPVVPATAVVENGGTFRTFVIARGRVEERIVRPADRDGASVAIVSGLSVGERVVASPTAQIRDGIRVK
jgi:membrane fusion protein (multidrug efflux system)